MPPARLATGTASRRLMPAASMAASAGDYRIAGAGHIETPHAQQRRSHSARPRASKSVMPSSLRVSKTACRLRSVRSWSPPCCGQVIFRLVHAPTTCSQLGAIGRDHGGVAVTLVVICLWDQSSTAMPASPGRCAIMSRDMRQATFAVNLKTAPHGLMLRHTAARRLPTWEASTSVFRRVLEVEAYQLLLTADHTQLHRGFHLRHRGRKWVGDAGVCNQRFKLVTGFIVTDHRQERSLRAQCHDVVGHVGSTRQCAPRFAGHAHHGNRRFRAEIRSTAPYQ